MSLIKSILKYAIILFVIAFAVVSILAGIMLLFPNVKLFGFRYAASKTGSAIIVNNATVSSVTVETNNFDIVVLPNSEEGVSKNNRLRMVIENRYTGFSNAKYNKEIMNQTLVLNLTTNEYVPFTEFKDLNLSNFRTSEGNYVIKIKEPTGLISYGNSKISIYVPENAENVAYNLKTNKGAIKFIKNAIHINESLSTSDITIDVKSALGSFNLDNAKMATGSSLNIANYIGKVDINSEQIGNVVINSNSGNFTFKNIGYEEFAGSLTVTGNNPYVRANKVYGNINFDATTGFIEIKEVAGDSIISTQNGIIRIDKALGGIETNNKSGETTIKQIGESVDISKPVNITSKSGSIKLGGSESATSEEVHGVYYLTKISAESSKVVVNNMYAKLKDFGADYNEIETTKGSVTVNFGESDDIKYLDVETSSGKITLKNIYGVVNAKTGNSSKIYAEFARFAEGKICNFTTSEGNVEVYMPDPTNDADKQYNLNILNKYNKLDIQIGNFTKEGFDGEKDNNGYYNFTKSFPENATTNNTINIKTISGEVIVEEKL